MRAAGVAAPGSQLRLSAALHARCSAAQMCPLQPLLQFTKLNTFFREEARQRDGGAPAGNHGGGH